MLYREFYGDLFQIKTEYTLVHCISADCAMGKGIASIFAEVNPRMRESLLSRRPMISNALHYNGEGPHAVINLVTKQRYFHKPTRKDFNESIRSLRRVVETYHIDKIAMPLIGAGLDKLSWSVNRQVIQNTFSDLDIDIVVVINK